MDQSFVAFVIMALLFLLICNLANIFKIDALEKKVAGLEERELTPKPRGGTGTERIAP